MPWSPDNKYIRDFWFASKGEDFYLQALRAERNYKPDRRRDLASVGFEGRLSDPRRVSFKANGSIELTDEH